MPNPYMLNFNKLNKGTKNVVRIAKSEVALQAILVGFLAGLFAVLFQFCIEYFSQYISVQTQGFSFSYKLLLMPLITALGGLIAGIMVCKYCPDGGGSGIPLVKYSLSKLTNRIRLRSVVTKFFAGIVGIGSGLSLGREGPSVHLGAGAGTLVSKMLNHKGILKHKLIAAGSGAALAATFNSPIAAAVFVFEELLHVFTSAMLFPVLLATVTAATIARFFLGNHFAFVIPATQMPISSENIIVFVILGIVAGYAGVGFSKYIQLNINLFKCIKIPSCFKPALAGFIVGLVGVFIPFLLGPGNEAINSLLNGEITISYIVLILLLKFILTPLCFGSGAAGGLFLPTIMIGAMLGGLTSFIFNNFLSIQIDPTVVILVGMGAFLTAVVRTPITAVIIVFEMTGDYNHILPIMLSAAIAELIADKMHSISIYEILLQRFVPPEPTVYDRTVIEEVPVGGKI